MNTVPNTTDRAGGLDPTFRAGSGNLAVDLLRRAADALAAEGVPADAVQVDVNPLDLLHLHLNVTDAYVAARRPGDAVALVDRLAQRLGLPAKPSDHARYEDGAHNYMRSAHFDGGIYVVVSAWPVPMGGES